VFWGGADPGWVHGLLGCLLGPLLLGHCALLIEAPFNAELCWQVMERYGVTNFVYVPAVYRALAAAGAAVAKQYTLQLQRASSAGEPLNPEAIHWFQEVLNVPVYDQYGQTELLILVGNYHAFDMPIKPGSMGLPMPGCRVSLVDEHGNEVGTNAIGQIAMDRTGFAYMFQGYWKEPQKSGENLRGTWHLTGDMARKDADGYFWFAGRADDLMNTSGYRIGPAEIESALLEHPDVVEAAAISVPDPQRGEVIKAYVVLQPGVQESEALAGALQQMVRERVGRHAVPRLVEFIDTLPKTPSGKIQRFLLRNANKTSSQGGSA
jgi:acetyl-CoA synthetase